MKSRYSFGKRVAGRVRQVDHVGAGFDRPAADLRDEGRVGAGRVLAGELDLVDAARGVGDGGRRLRPRPRRASCGASSPCGSGSWRGRCAAASAARPASASTAASMSSRRVRASEATVADSTARAAAAHALGVAGRGGCEARLDDVDAEPLELPGDLCFLVLAAARCPAIARRRGVSYRRLRSCANSRLSFRVRPRCRRTGGVDGWRVRRRRVFACSP